MVLAAIWSKVYESHGLLNPYIHCDRDLAELLSMD